MYQLEQGIPSGVGQTRDQMSEGLVQTITSALRNARGPVMSNVSAFRNSINSEMIANNAAISVPVVRPTINVDSIRQPVTPNMIDALNGSRSEARQALNNTQISNMSTSNVSNSNATTNNFSMTVITDQNGAARVRRNYRRMKMRRTII